ALPIGGYVKFLGDANAASAGADELTLGRLSPEELRHTMHGAPLWARTATVLAGPGFNFLFSILVFAGLFLWQGVATDRPEVGKLLDLPGGSYGIEAGDQILSVEGQATPDWDSAMKAVDGLPPVGKLSYLVERKGEKLTVEGPALYPPRVATISPGTAGFAAGLKAGDVIQAIDASPVQVFGDIQARVKAGDGKALTLSVWRAGQVFEVTLTPKSTDLPKPDGGFETRYLIGLTGGFFFEPVTRQVGPWEALTGAASQTWAVARSSLSGMAHVVTGAISSCNLRGPLSIAQTSGQVASQGLPDFIWFLAVLSTAVGFLNLFPIPMLDGGHLVFYAYEAVVGRPLPEKTFRLLISVGLAMVLALTMFGLSNDLLCP
ncbi:MAG: RIP metalloprotease RseP, partial [Rhodobacteraceae bacterium]|nr:RIP metalloprotease RseP [Paracoccaceae bacterium]